MKYANLVMLAFNSWGLWNSTTRAGMLSLMTGTIILSVIIWNCKPRKLLKNVGFAALLVAVMLVVNICMGYFGWSRAYALINKTSDMLLNTANFGARARYGSRAGMWSRNIQSRAWGSAIISGITSTGSEMPSKTIRR